MSTQSITENRTKTLAYDYKRKGLQRITLEGTVEYEETQDRLLLKMGVKTLGYYYRKEDVTKDNLLNTVGKGNLLAGLLLLANLLEDE